MKYLSLCSGIEAASVAWHPLGWKPVAFSEIEKFPSELLGHHYPNVPNMGDMTKYKEWKLNDTIDLVVGGTPCQSFSVAGLRKGLEDPRGNLALTFCGILDKFRPKWFIWENVPGVLSSGGGRDFGSFLGAVAELGYGFSYRVLDAQNFGVPQRRRRVFVVGHLGDWRPAAEVLFEPESLSRHTEESRQKRKGTPRDTTLGIDTSGPLQARDYKDMGTDGLNRTSSKMIPLLHQDHIDALCARDYKGLNSDSLDKKAIVEVFENHPSDSRVKEMGDTCQTVTSTWGSGGGNIPFVLNTPIALAENTIGRQPLTGGNGNGFTEGGPMYTLNATGVHGVAHTFKIRGGCEGER
jgi:DNA-cytosine methyltransferase